MDEKKAKWPNFRVAEGTINRAKAVLDRARNGMSITEWINEVLVQTLDRIEGSAEVVTLPEIVLTLRQQLGLKSTQLAAADVLKMIGDLQGRMNAWEAGRAAPEDDQSSRAAETPPRRKPKPSA